jgi:hypothetical protein
MPGAKSQGRLGTYVASTVSGETVRAFIPPPLPPPNLELNGLQRQLEQANQGLGRLNGMTKLLPDVRFLPLFICAKRGACILRRAWSGLFGQVPDDGLVWQAPGRKCLLAIASGRRNRAHKQ